MFDFMFTMPAKLSVNLPVAIIVSGKKRKKYRILTCSRFRRLCKVWYD